MAFVPDTFSLCDLLSRENIRKRQAIGLSELVTQRFDLACTTLSVTMCHRRPPCLASGSKAPISQLKEVFLSMSFRDLSLCFQEVPFVTDTVLLITVDSRRSTG